MQASRQAEPTVPEDLQALVTGARESIIELLASVPAEDMQKAQQIVAAISGKDDLAEPQAENPSSETIRAAQRLEALL
jgi:hypothetical protein